MTVITLPPAPPGGAPAPAKTCQSCGQSRGPANALCPVCKHPITRGLPLVFLGQPVGLIRRFGIEIDDPLDVAACYAQALADLPG